MRVLLYRYKEEDEWGMIDGNGKSVIKPIYDEISYFAEGYALARNNRQWVYINKKEYSC